MSIQLKHGLNYTVRLCNKYMFILSCMLWTTLLPCKGSCSIQSSKISFLGHLVDDISHFEFEAYPVTLTGASDLKLFGRCISNNYYTSMWINVYQQINICWYIGTIYMYMYVYVYVYVCMCTCMCMRMCMYIYIYIRIRIRMYMCHVHVPCTCICIYTIMIEASTESEKCQ